MISAIGRNGDRERCEQGWAVQDREWDAFRLVTLYTYDDLGNLIGKHSHFEVNDLWCPLPERSGL